MLPLRPWQPCADSQPRFGVPALRDEHIDALRRLTLEPPQGAQLTAPDRVNAGRAALGAPNVQFPGLEVDIIPTQGHELAGSQAVAVGDQDGRGIPMAPAVFTSSL